MGLTLYWRKHVIAVIGHAVMSMGKEESQGMCREADVLDRSKVSLGKKRSASMKESGSSESHSPKINLSPNHILAMK